MSAGRKMGVKSEGMTEGKGGRKSEITMETQPNIKMVVQVPQNVIQSEACGSGKSNDT